MAMRVRPRRLRCRIRSTCLIALAASRCQIVWHWPMADTFSELP
jgi:hypothetical protein